MARATTCMFEGKELSIEDAIEIRDKRSSKERKKLRFTCVECGKHVRAHRASGHGEAHFEHFARNPDCKLSDPER